VNKGIHKIKDKEKKRTAWKHRESRKNRQQTGKRRRERIYSKNPRKHQLEVHESLLVYFSCVLPVRSSWVCFTTGSNSRLAAFQLVLSMSASFFGKLNSSENIQK
jgi:hypothetical protein